MDFDIPSMHISEGSPEGRVIAAIVRRDRVSPEQAIKKVLREQANPSPAEELIGLFSSPEDAAIFDEAMEFMREMRTQDRFRDLEP